MAIQSGKVRKFDLGIIRRLNPDIIVLELDSNDLTKLPGQTVGSELENLVRYLHDEFNVKSIAVCQVIRRHSFECTLKYSLALPNFICISNGCSRTYTLLFVLETQGFLELAGKHLLAGWCASK